MFFKQAQPNAPIERLFLDVFFLKKGVFCALPMLGKGWWGHIPIQSEMYNLICSLKQ